MRAMVKRGDIGKVRLIKAEFAHGFHADAADADNPRVRWRNDPAQAGISAQFADCGIHRCTWQLCERAGCARAFSRFRLLPALAHAEDDGHGLLPHGWRRNRAALDQFRRHRAHARAEHPGVRRDGRPALGPGMAEPALLYPAQRAHADHGARRPGLSPEADRASRVTIGHAEGMPLAFANIYADLSEVIRAKKEGRKPDPLACHYPTAVDGLRSIAAIKAAVDSARQAARGLTRAPPSLR